MDERRLRTYNRADDEEIITSSRPVLRYTTRSGGEAEIVVHAGLPTIVSSKIADQLLSTSGVALLSTTRGALPRSYRLLSLPAPPEPSAWGGRQNPRNKRASRV